MKKRILNVVIVSSFVFLAAMSSAFARGTKCENECNELRNSIMADCGSTAEEILVCRQRADYMWNACMARFCE